MSQLSYRNNEKTISEFLNIERMIMDEDGRYEGRNIKNLYIKVCKIQANDNAHNHNLKRIKRTT